MPALLVSHHRPGFYFRVLREGAVQAGDEIVQVAAGPETMTVAEVDGLLYLPGHSCERVRSALRIPALSPGWQASFRAMTDQAGAPGGTAGAAGLPAGNAGTFVLQPGDNPVLLISAGVGATPVLAMLHALADAASGRDVWWLHGARNRAEEPFAEESRSLLAALARGHRHVYYSRPAPGDTQGRDDQTAGRLSASVLTACPLFRVRCRIHARPRRQRGGRGSPVGMFVTACQHEGAAHARGPFRRPA